LIWLHIRDLNRYPLKHLVRPFWNCHWITAVLNRYTLSWVHRRHLIGQRHCYMCLFIWGINHTIACVYKIKSLLKCSKMQMELHGVGEDVCMDSNESFLVFCEMRVRKILPETCVPDKEGCNHLIYRYSSVCCRNTRWRHDITECTFQVVVVLFISAHFHCRRQEQIRSMLEKGQLFFRLLLFECFSCDYFVKKKTYVKLQKFWKCLFVTTDIECEIQRYTYCNTFIRGPPAYLPIVLPHSAILKSDSDLTFNIWQIF